MPRPRTHRHTLAPRALPRVAGALLLAFVAVAGQPARAGDQPGPPLPPADPAYLRDALAELPARSLLRAHLVDGACVEGRPGPARGDTLWLLPDGKPGAAARPVALADIGRLQRGVTANAEGAGIGAVFGGALGALTGAGLASLGASLDESGADHDGAVAGATAMGLVGGAVLGGLLGGGFGAFARTWEDVDPGSLRAERLASLPPPRDPTTGRLLLEAGWTRGTGAGYRDNGAMLALGLLSRCRAGCELGPVLRCHLIDGMPSRPGAQSEPSGAQPAGSLLLEARLPSAAPGWRPWGEAGAGAVLTDNLHPGGHLGVGLRHRDARGREWGLAVRRTFVGGADVGASGLWTAALGISFRP